MATVQLLQLDEDNNLRCPNCGDVNGTHIDTVVIGARGEDAPVTRIVVDASAASVAMGPGGPGDGEHPSRRRHWIELVVGCEFCDGGSIVLAQHKGQTAVSFAADEPAVAL